MSSRTTHSSTQTKARKRALDILFEAELREADPLATLAERAADAEPPVRDYTAVPDAVAVSEAVGLVSQLSTDDSPSFVNGVLGTVVETKAMQANNETKGMQANNETKATQTNHETKSQAAPADAEIA
jgi:transcription termination factor NusB